MDIRFWGTRGSLPRPIDHRQLVDLLSEMVAQAKKTGVTDLDGFLDAAQGGSLGTPLSFGGNTSCTQISAGNETIFIDSGSGFAWAGDQMLKEGRKVFHLFQTHFHWDHIMGLPFFVPLYIPGTELNIYFVHKSGEEDIKIQFNGRNFPVAWDQIGAKVNFHHLKLYKTISIGPMGITPFALDHPGGSFGYRVEANNRSFAVGVDGEYKRFTPKELGKDLAYYQNLDVFVFDGQYEMDELVSRYDWGHCTPTIGVDLALREGIKHMVFTHHDPKSLESKSRRMLEEARQYLQTQLPSVQKQWQAWGQPQGPILHTAYDGLRISMDDNGIKFG